MNNNLVELSKDLKSIFVRDQEYEIATKLRDIEKLITNEHYNESYKDDNFIFSLLRAIIDKCKNNNAKKRFQLFVYETRDSKLNILLNEPENDS
jgi:hypothetical protein